MIRWQGAWKVGAWVGFVWSALAAHAAPPETARGLHPAARLFPLIHAERDDASQRAECNALWPFLLWREDAAASASLTAVHPLFSTGSDRDGRFRFLDVLFPLAGSRRIASDDPARGWIQRRWLLPFYFDKRLTSDRGDEHRTALLPFFFYGRKTLPAEAAYFILLPFYWDIDKGATYHIPLTQHNAGRSWALWPFYGVFHQLFGAERLRFVLWPLWIRSERGPNVTHSALWPIFSRTSGPDVYAWRCWPLVNWKRREGVGYRFGYLWPLGHRWRQGEWKGDAPVELDALLPLFFRFHRDPVRIAYYFPFYGVAEGPQEISRAWLWPLFIRTRHTEPDWTQWRIFHFILVGASGEQRRRHTFFPFYSYREQPRQRRRSVCYPIFFDRFDEKETGETYARQYLVPFYLHQRWERANGELIRENRCLTPLFRRVRRADGSTEFSALHLFFFADQPGLLRNWAPLWTLYASRDDGHGRVERSVFHRLWRRRTVEGVGSEWEINLLIGGGRTRLEGGGAVSLLGLEFEW